MTIRGVLIILLSFIYSVLQATTYYVSISGSDSNNGLTTTTPWLTLQYAETHATAPGDIIALKRGDVWSTLTALAIKHSGSSVNPITWDGSLWGSGAIASIRSSGTRSDGNNSVVNIIACSYVTFKNITVDGNNTANCFGLVIGGHSGFSKNTQNNENHIIIDGCSILNIGSSSVYSLGILVQTWYTDINNIIIQNCTLDGCADEQLCVYGGKTQDGGTPRECKEVLIKNNTLTNFGRRNASTADGILINNKVTNCIIEGNTLTTGPNGFGTVLAFASNESTPGYIPTGVIVRYNKLIASKINQWCLTIDGGQAQSITFYSNIFISTSTTATNCGNVWIFIFTPNYTGAHFNFYNNVFYTKAGKNFQDDTSYGTGIVNFKNNIVINAASSGGACYVVNTAASTKHSNNSFYRTAHW